jgi:predicted nucleic acid-binding Zn ribbon protein
MVKPERFGTFQTTKGQQASRLRPVPDELGSLIKLVRILPPGVPLISFEDALLFVESESKEAAGIEKASKALNICLDGLGEEDGVAPRFREYVLELPDACYLDKISALQSAIDRYVSFREARLKLCGVAHINRLRPKRLKEFERFLESLGAGTRTEIDELGKVRFKKDWFGEAIEGVEAERVRECPICGVVFWAGRIDQWCCNSRCASMLRKKKKRERDAGQRAEEKLRRLRNEEYKSKRLARQLDEDRVQA